MPEIYLTPDTLEQTATNIDVQQQALEGFLAKLDNTVEDLLSDWKGDAQTAFARVWGEKRETYREFTGDMSNFSDFLRSYAGTMRNIDTGQAPRIS